MSRYISKALIDWNDFGKTIGDVNGGFSLLEFLDYCTVLEGIILYYELVHRNFFPGSDGILKRKNTAIRKR